MAIEMRREDREDGNPRNKNQFHQNPHIRRAGPMLWTITHALENFESFSQQLPLDVLRNYANETLTTEK